MREVAFVNGQFVDRANAMVSIEDRACQFGDGVYEVVKFYGRRPFRLLPHLERFQRSSAALRIQGVPSIDDWQATIARLIQETDLPEDPSENTILYLQISRGVAPRYHAFPKVTPPPGLVAHFRVAPSYTPLQRSGGLALSTQPDERWQRCHIKAICLLPVVMAKQAAIEAGAFEAVLVRDGIVTEGGATNLYCVKNGVVYTHPQGNYILPGITRDLAFEAAANAGIEIREEPVPVAEFRTADEIFMSSTTMDIMPATVLDGTPIGDGKPGPVTLKMAAAAQAIIDEEIAAVPAGGER